MVQRRVTVSPVACDRPEQTLESAKPVAGDGANTKFKQDGDQLTVTCTGFPQGTNTVVRVVRLT